MGTHPIFESDFDCLTDSRAKKCPDVTMRKRRLSVPKADSIRSNMPWKPSDRLVPVLEFWLHGVVIVAEKKNQHKLLDTNPSVAEKIYRIDDHLAVGIAGITSDANALIAQLRLIAQQHRLVYRNPMPVEQLVRRMADNKQYFTMHGGVRPYGVSILYCGWDKHLGFQLYQGDPSGNYGGWKATSIGGSSQSATSMLEQDYDESMDLEKAINLAMGIYLKTLDTQTLNAEKIEVSLIKRVNGTVQYTVMKPADVNKYCKKAEEEKKKKAEEEEKKRKEKAASSKK